MNHKLTELKGETNPHYSWGFQYLTSQLVERDKMSVNNLEDLNTVTQLT